jgi:hypothetical protein
VNWPQLATGALMLVLPFAGPWWTAEVGEGALEFGISPFDMHVVVAGQPLHSDLIGLFLLATKLSFLVAGALLLAASLRPKRWWAQMLTRFGIRKPVWSVAGLLLTLLIGAFLVNRVLPGVLPFLVRAEGQEVEAAEIDISLPYISGSSVSRIAFQSQGTWVEISAPVRVGLTDSFWLAVLAAACGIASGIYFRKVLS